MRYKRETLQDMTRPLKQWLYKNKNNPYPTKGQKVELAEQSKMTLTQVSNWFANARRRLKNTVRGNELSWERRVSMYNTCVKGNQQSMDVSDDSAWESGDEGDLRDNHSPREPTEIPTETEHIPTLPQPTESKIDSQMDSFSRQIESALRKELTSAQSNAPLLNIPQPPVPGQSAESCSNSVKCIKQEPVNQIKQEPMSDNSMFTDSQTSAYNPLINPSVSVSDNSTKVTPNMSSVNLPNPISSYSYQPIKSESAPVAPPTNETIVSNITNQIAAYLMASTMNPFGFGQLLTPQMQEEARQHLALMQAHTQESDKTQNSSSANPTLASSTANTHFTNLFALPPSLPSTTSQASSHLSPCQTVSSNSIISQTSEAFSAHLSPNSFHSHEGLRRLSQNCSTSDSGMESCNDVTRDLIPSPAQSEGDLCGYPKSDTPKYKKTLLHRYLQGEDDGYEREMVEEGEEDSSPQDLLPPSHAPPTSTPLSSPSPAHPYQAYSPLDLRKRVRNLSGSMGSQEYEDISECDASDVASSGLTSPGFPSSVQMVTSHDGDVTDCHGDVTGCHDDVTGCAGDGSNVFDDLVKRWQVVNQGAPVTKQDEEKDELMMKEVSAIFTLANLASSRTNPAPQS